MYAEDRLPRIPCWKKESSGEHAMSVGPGDKTEQEINSRQEARGVQRGSSGV